MSNHIAAARYGRPTRYGGGGQGHHAPRRVWLPSQIDATGRTICATWSDRDDTWVIGVDVSCPSKWSRRSHIFTNYGAGGGYNAFEADLTTTLKKSPFVAETTDRAVWLAGSNDNGGIMGRLPVNDAWTNVSATYYGLANEGGSNDPRTAGSRLGLFTGDLSFLATIKDAAPRRGILKQSAAGGPWAEWAYATSRNWTAIVKSPQWDVIYGSVDGTAAGVDGVYGLTGLSTATATVTQFDTVGVGAPTLSDCRDIFAVTVGGVDYVYVVVGTTTDRGVWELAVTVDPSDGGFVPATDLTWRKVFTPDDTTNDRPQSICVFYDTTDAQMKAYLGLFIANTLATGSYSESTGVVNSYRRTHYRCLDLLDVSPVWANVTSDINVNLQTFGIDNVVHEHVISLIGESSIEKGRIGGGNHSCQSINVNPAGTEVVTVGKTTPWICTNPWDTTPEWRPFSYGLGALAGGYQAVIINEQSQGWFAFNDDDRGGWLVEYGSPGKFVWCLANDQTGIPTTSNATGTIARSVMGVEHTDGGLLFGARSARGYRVQFPFDPPAPQDVGLRDVGVQAEVDGTSVTVNLPAGALVGDLLLLHGTTRNATTAFPAITGWELLNSRVQGSNQRSALWGRYMNEGDVSVNLVAAGSGTLLGTITAWSGVTPSVPEDVAGFDEANSAAATYTVSAPIDTVTDEAMSIVFVATSDANALSMTTANGYTAAYSGASYDSTVGTSASQACAYKTQTPAGDVGSPVFTQTVNGNDGWVGIQIALRPIGTGLAQNAILEKDYTVSPGVASTDCIGFFDFFDGSANLRYLGVTKGAGIIRSAAGGGTPDVVELAVSSIADRTILLNNGSGTLWLCVPDTGIYRSTNYGDTWVLWWVKSIADPQHRWSGHITQDGNSVNDIWVTFEDGGIWKVTNAHTAPNGAGTGGSVPTGAVKVAGGSLPAGTERIGPAWVDEADGTVWVIRHPSAAAMPAEVHFLPRGTGTTWKQEEDIEIAEGAQLAQGVTGYAGMVLVPTSGQGLLRRVP